MYLYFFKSLITQKVPKFFSSIFLKNLRILDAILEFYDLYFCFFVFICESTINYCFLNDHIIYIFIFRMFNKNIFMKNKIYK